MQKAQQYHVIERAPVKMDHWRITERIQKVSGLTVSAYFGRDMFHSKNKDKKINHTIYTGDCLPGK